MTPTAAIGRERRGFHLKSTLGPLKEWWVPTYPRDLPARRDHWSGREEFGTQRLNSIQKVQDKAWGQLWPSVALVWRETTKPWWTQRKMFGCLDEDFRCLSLPDFQLTDITAPGSTWKPGHRVCFMEICWDQRGKKLENESWLKRSIKKKSYFMTSGWKNQKHLKMSAASPPASRFIHCLNQQWAFLSWSWVPIASIEYVQLYV